jgi:CRISPR-associated protein Cas8a1/Csx13
MELTIGLFDPGMSYHHRVGLAGLYMTLRYFDKTGKQPGSLKWELSKDSIHLHADDNLKGSFEDLFQESFKINKDGLVDFAAHRNHPMGDVERVLVSESVRRTYLQHNKQNKIPKATQNKTLSFNMDENNVFVTYKPFINPYAHADGCKLLFSASGNLKKNDKIKNWLYPGAAVRHSGLSGTEVQEPPEKLLCLLFTPTASLYYRIFHKGADGKFDKKRSTAILLPHITDLEKYDRCFNRYLLAPYKRLSVDGLGDAALSAMLELKADDDLETVGVDGCTVVIMGTVTWSKQQQSRTSIKSYEGFDANKLDLFDVACRCLPNRVVVTKSKNDGAEAPGKPFFVATSLARGLISENIAGNRDWLLGFTGLMMSKDQAKKISYERGGLMEMTDAAKWPYETDKKFVKAIHNAIRNRYGALASRATQSGEPIRFDREYERMRTGLMRAKNAQTMRAELSDFFARGGSNKTLRESWQDLLPLFTGSDWQRAKDLALFALASYAGKGVEEIETAEQNNSGEEMK